MESWTLFINNATMQLLFWYYNVGRRCCSTLSCYATKLRQQLRQYDNNSRQQLLLVFLIGDEVFIIGSLQTSIKLKRKQHRRWTQFQPSRIHIGKLYLLQYVIPLNSFAHEVLVIVIAVWQFIDFHDLFSAAFQFHPRIDHPTLSLTSLPE